MLRRLCMAFAAVFARAAAAAKGVMIGWDEPLPGHMECASADPLVTGPLLMLRSPLYQGSCKYQTASQCIQHR